MTVTEYQPVISEGLYTIDIFAIVSREAQQNILENYPANIAKQYRKGQNHFVADEHGKAYTIFEKLYKKHPQEKLFSLATMAALIESNLEEAEKSIDDICQHVTDTAEYLYLKGTIADKKNYPAEAMEFYQKAVEKDDNFIPALFRLAYYADLHGDDETTLELYERCAALKPVHAGVLINLGIIYEDRGEYNKACSCYRKILAKAPNHPRAKLYLRDAEASTSMYLDEEKERLQDRHNQILATPISDFELSVRSRNCLNKMKIRTLGSLVKKSEAELLSYKNFGETSLAEIKEILGKKGLSLGMDTENFDPTKKDKKNPKAAAEKSPKNKEILSMPVASLELSVRSRKCLESLGTKTVGDLIKKSEQDLLGCRNFGQTSMTEIKRKLHELGLSLAGSSS